MGDPRADIMYHNFLLSESTNKLNCGTTAYLQSSLYNNHQQAKDKFDQIFANMLQTQKDDFNSDCCVSKKYCYVYTITDVFATFLWYAMFFI